MGNCLFPRQQYIGEESISLVNNNNEVWHLIDNNKEFIQQLNEKIEELDIRVNDNIKAMADDIIRLAADNDQLTKNNDRLTEDMTQLKDYYQSSRLSHQSSSRYGGVEPESTHADLEGPSFINFSISE
jgi:hypothetical protein